MSNKSWYETGYEGAQKEADRKSFGYPPDRLWQKAEASKKIIFIGDDPFCISEHSWCDHESKWHHATCTAKINESGCGACGANGVGAANYTGHYTIIDVDGYTTSKGVEDKYRMMLLPAKTKVLTKFRDKRKIRGALINHLWLLTRSDAMAPNTGDDLDHVRELEKPESVIDYATFKGKSVKEMIEKANGSGHESEKTRKFMSHYFQIPSDGPIPMKVPQFNYPELFKPLEYGELKSLASNAKPFGKDSKKTNSSKSDDVIPF
jgi:hypothetical protein